MSPDDDVRGWVRRLGSYLRIFGPPAPGTFGYRTDARTGHLDHLIEQAKEREAEFGLRPPKRSDISDRQALEACAPWGGVKEDRPMLDGLGLMEQRSALQRLQHAGWPFKVAWRKLELLDDRGWIDYGVSINFPWRTEEGEAELARLRGT